MPGIIFKHFIKITITEISDFRKNLPPIQSLTVKKQNKFED